MNWVWPLPRMLVVNEGLYLELHFQPFINRCLVKQPFPISKDLVHHPIDSQPFINGWPWGSR